MKHLLAAEPTGETLSQPAPDAAAQPRLAQDKQSKGRAKPVATAHLGTRTKPVITVNAATGMVSVNIGTLTAGDSVTITFQVTVNNPYPGGPNVSNQGTVSGTNFSDVLTDDPLVGGASDPTLTPVNIPNINARDAQATEPASGFAPILFTVTLSAATTATVTVNYATADGGATPATGGGSCGTAGVDYESTSGALTFNAGERVKTVSVNVCSDAVAEPNETFLLNLSGATGGIIVDGQAVGTITQTATPGTFLISELRTSGPGGADDDFLELYNNSNSPLTVTASDSSSGYGVFKMGANCNSTPVLIGTIPNSTVIPARGHFLLVGSAYSLGAYAAGNQTLTSNVDNDQNVAVFTTADVGNISTLTRLDAVGFSTNTGGNCDLLREGNNLTAAGGSTSEHSFVRRTVVDTPQDTNDNAADFMLVATDGNATLPTAALGAPGPENLSSPRLNNSVIPSLVDPGAASSLPPNRARLFCGNAGAPNCPADPLTSTNGYLSIRRKFTNNTGSTVTRLRFRIIDITTLNNTDGLPAPVADLRAITSADVTVMTSIGSVLVKGTTLESPPAQPNGGGLNSSLTVALPGGGLANGAEVNVQWLLGVSAAGRFRFFVIIEALP